MKCRECIDFLLAYVEGDLPEDELAVFEDHLDRCPPCRDYVESYRKTIELEKEACWCEEGETLSDDVPQKLVDAILAARKASSPKT